MSSLIPLRSDAQTGDCVFVHGAYPSRYGAFCLEHRKGQNMTSDLILHHYDFSHYSEKVRLVLGLKGLTWRSVEVPSTLPKPDYLPLTGGYRRAPALQMGADVFCDTVRIIDELERCFPEPSVYPGSPGPDAAAQRGLIAGRRNSP